MAFTYLVIQQLTPRASARDSLVGLRTITVQETSPESRLPHPPLAYFTAVVKPGNMLSQNPCRITGCYSSEGGFSAFLSGACHVTFLVGNNDVSDRSLLFIS